LLLPKQTGATQMTVKIEKKAGKFFYTIFYADGLVYKRNRSFGFATKEAAAANAQQIVDWNSGLLG
jgi:hypothetical protein